MFISVPIASHFLELAVIGQVCRKVMALVVCLDPFAPPKVLKAGGVGKGGTVESNWGPLRLLGGVMESALVSVGLGFGGHC